MADLDKAIAAAREAVAGSVQSGSVAIPFWVIDYAQKIELFMRINGVDAWAIGGIQSRDLPPPQAPPAAQAVPADTDRLLFLQKFMFDLGEVEYNTEKGCMCGGWRAFSLSGGGIDVEGETLVEAIDRAMLAVKPTKNEK